MLNYLKNNRGFTLVEVMVALGIFSVMLVIIVSVFTRFTQSGRRQMGEQALQEDLRLALELFNKEVRTGYGDTYSKDVTSSEPRITFRNQSGVCVEYSLYDGGMARAEKASDPANDCLGVDYPTPPQKLTSPSTKIDKNNSKFIVFPSELATDNSKLKSQGYVTIMVVANTVANSANVHVQSTVTSRQYKPFYVAP